MVVVEGVDRLGDEGRGSKPVKEVWKLYEYLMAHGGGIKGLWTDEVDFEDILEVIEVSQGEFHAYLS
jgi:hypothetical protein